MANWHIILAYEMSFEQQNEMQEIFEEEFREDYVFQRTQEYLIAGPVAANGQRYTFDKKEKVYRISSFLWASEFHNFYRFLVNEFRKMYGNGAQKLQSPIFNTDLLLDFVKNLDYIYLKQLDNRTIQKIQAIPNNAYISFDKLSPMKVQEGYPFPTRYTSQLSVMSLLHSHEKMHCSVAETVAFHNFLDHVKKVSKNRYRLAKYLQVVAY